ncbi:MAG: dynamin family protein [Chthoniobacterales bacterium]
MTPHILSPELKQQYEVLRGLLQRALWLAEKRADYEATQILRIRLTNLQAPALLVIVGEVKAGKSSFINALVRENVCEVAPGPCTTRIQELLYGLERNVATLGQSWERVYLPKEVLREITIVDTPGTNSIIRDHQTITENYIPQSDLVVFVFSAVNPHTKSAWELLTAIRKDWHRKMVFILQQADRASQQELTTNREHVRQYAQERQVEEPTIFTLSAKQEMEGNPQSGFAEFRHYLQSAIARGEVWRMKVEGSYETIRVVIAKLLEHLRAEQEAVAEERAFYHDLLQKVEARETKARALKQLIVESLSATYDRLAEESEHEFAEGLRIGKLLRRTIPFLRDKDLKTWLEDLEAGFQASALKQIATEAPDLSRDLFEEMQTLMKELAEGVAQRQEGLKTSMVLPPSAQHLEILEQLRAKLDRIRVADDILTDEVAETSDIRRLALAGSGVAVIGVVIVVLSENAWLNITGTAFAAIGTLLTASGLLWRRSGILRDFRRKLGRSRKEFHDRIEAEFSKVFDGLFYELRQFLTETIFRLDLQASHINPVLDETFRVGEAASELLLGFQRNLTPPPFARI